MCDGVKKKEQEQCSCCKIFTNAVVNKERINIQKITLWLMKVLLLSGQQHTDKQKRHTYVIKII